MRASVNSTRENRGDDPHNNGDCWSWEQRLLADRLSEKVGGDDSHAGVNKAEDEQGG